MDFARKQLEKYGWKDGEGLGKPGNEGIITPIRAKYKSGKEGMGFDLAKDLVDPWWENAYNDSLSRVSIQMQATVDSNKRKKASKRMGSPASLSPSPAEQEDENLVISMNTDGNDPESSAVAQIMKRMMRSNFTDFSKGATLTNGKEEEVRTENDASKTPKPSGSQSSSTLNLKRQLTDEELFKACGGRTCHKAARFGYRLSGKLARLAAQDEIQESKRKKPKAAEDSS